MNNIFTKPLTGFVLLFILFTNPANSQAIISGHIFNDINNNGSYDSGEGLEYITVWLMDNAAVSPYYKVYPVQTSITSIDGNYSFTNVANGNYQVKVKMSTTYNAILSGSKHSRITNIVSDNNPYSPDNNPNGSTDLAVNSASSYNNIDFGFKSNATVPGFIPQSQFSFDNGANSFNNVMSKTFDLAPENCGGTVYNPTITFTTDKQCSVSSQVYPQAGSNSNANGMYWPGLNKGGFNTNDITLQMNFGQACYDPVNNDRVTLTVDFSKMVTDVRFTIYDIDCVNPQLVDGSIDHVKVTGYNGSNPVMPVIALTQSIPFNNCFENTISGWPDYPDNNLINNFPDQFNSGDADNGNADIYFTDVIDKIVIEYEEYAPVLIPSVKKILVPATPINNESQWGVPATPTVRGISIGGIGYTLYCNLLAANGISFDANASGQKVSLQWKNENEQQLQQYRVERLSASGSWLGLGNINPAGPGILYHFTDLHPAKGVNEYRLMLMNTDGSFHLSETRKVTISGNSIGLEIINNPASTLNLLVYGEAYDIVVFDAAGQRLFDYPVQHSSSSGSMMISLDQFILHTGFYFIKALFANGQVRTAKFVKN